jgi:hypothetical protein
LSVNSDVKEIYENFEVLSDYRYFRSGPASRPRVVIGLRDDYALQSDYWQPIELTPEMLDRWLGFRGHHKKYFLGNNGFDIMDGQGNKVGIWYGLVDAHDWAAVQMIADKTVSITPPIQDGRRLRSKFTRE